VIAIRRTIFSIFLGILAVALPAPAAEGVRTITVHAKRYRFLPAEITVSKDEPVRLILISDDVDHGLAVRDLGIRADMPKGKRVEVMVTPAQVGDFKGSCSRFCGAGHGSMKFVVHVVDKAEHPG
jgi:cytochrome c oxidase subunit 2